jgi:hypothetical protein
MELINLNPALPPENQLALPGNVLELKQAWLTLQEQQKTLDADRERFSQEQAYLRQYWKRRLNAEWERLRQEAEVLSSEQLTLERQRRDANTEIEFNRRHMETRWNELRRQQMAWQEQFLQQQATLRDQQRLLERQRRILSADQRTWEKECVAFEDLRQARQTEIEDLNRRVQHHREKITGLQDEVSLLERRLQEQADAFLEGKSVPENAPFRPTTTINNPEEWLGPIAAILQDMQDQNQRMSQYQEFLLNLREAWQQEWDRALDRLQQRENAVRDQEEALIQRHQSLRKLAEKVQLQVTDLDIRQKQVQGLEARLLREKSAFRAAKERFKAYWKAKALSAKSRHKLAMHLCEQLAQKCKELWERTQLREKAAETNRYVFEKIRTEFERRQADLDAREKDLAARDMVITHAEQQLIHNDPNPAGAEAELQARLDHWRKMTLRPLKRLKQREQDLLRLHNDLDEFRKRLLFEHVHLEEKLRTLAQMEIDKEKDASLLTAERTRWRQQILAMQQERTHLLAQIRDLHEQIERLTCALLQSETPVVNVAMAA